MVRKMLASAALLAGLFCSNDVIGQSLTKLWTSDTTLLVPESVLPVKGENLLYFSNIDGASDQKDGKGSIGKMTRDGKLIQLNWVSGLNAPKGLRMYQHTLFVADLDEVVAIDTKTGKIRYRTKVEDAVFLNDIAIDGDGNVYVSDTRKGKVHKIENGKVTTIKDKLKGPNGLLWQKEGLYVLDRGSLWLMAEDGEWKTIAEEMESSTDGIERVDGKDFLVSCWAGLIYYVTQEGKVTQMLDTRDIKSNTADIGYDDETKTAFVPTFLKNSIVAYKLIP